MSQAAHSGVSRDRSLLDDRDRVAHGGERVVAFSRWFGSVVLAGLLAHGAWVFVARAGATLRSPWSGDYGEGCTLALAELLAERGNYFPDLTDYPFFVANYPPAFLSLVALAQKALGPSLFVPRLIAFVATLGILAVLFDTLSFMLGARVPALAFTVLFVMPWFVTTWAALARVDTTAILLSLAGLSIVLRQGPGAGDWPALPVFWLAFFTKQSALLAPAAVLLELGLARDRRFPRVLAAYALPLVALFGLLVLATHGGAWRHLVVYTAASSYEWGRMGESGVQLAVIGGPLLLLVWAGEALEPAAFRKRTGRILLLYFGLNLAGFATIAKAGAAQNCFIEPWLATVLLAAWAFRCLRQGRPWLRLAWPAWLAVAAATAHFAYPSLDRLPHELRHPENARAFVALDRLIRETPGPVLSENLSLLVLARRRVFLEPFGVTQLVQRDLLRPDRLVQDCEAGLFPLVVVERRMWDVPGFGECIERRYEPLGAFGRFLALHPRPGAWAGDGPPGRSIERPEPGAAQAVVDARQAPAKRRTISPAGSIRSIPATLLPACQ